MIALIKKLLTGISIPQEYVCIALEQLSQPLRVYLNANGQKKEITSHHLFLGYKPLIIGLVSESSAESDITLNFDSNEQTLGALRLRKIDEKKLGTTPIAFYEGVNGRHHFLSRFHQLANDLMERMKRKPKGNVSLEGNLYEQVRIAYSVARKIAVITVGDEGLINIFPTDLHGAVGTDYYVSSLRTAGEACKQVMQFGRLAISDVDASELSRVYALGKNHMRSLRSVNEFNLSEYQTDALKLPLPLGVGAYRELEVVDHFDIGIHRVFIYKVLTQKNLTKIQTLAHVHQYYAQWRTDQKLETNFLFR